MNIKNNFYYEIFEDGNSEDKALIVLTGSDGGIENAKKIAKIFSCKGYITMAIGYFKLKGIRKSLSLIPIEIMEEAVSILKNYKNGKVKKIAVYGWSKGAEFALVAASYIKDINLVIALNPSAYIYEGINFFKFPSGSSSWKYKEKELSYVSMKNTSGLKFIQRMIKEKAFKISFRYEEALKREIFEDAIIKVENIKGRILLFSVSCDEIWPSKDSCIKMIDRLKGHNYKYEHINFKYGSHILAPLDIFAAKILREEKKYPIECARARRETFEYSLKWLADM